MEYRYKVWGTYDFGGASVPWLVYANFTDSAAAKKGAVEVIKENFKSWSSIAKSTQQTGIECLGKVRT